MLDARTARILAKENEEDIEARRRREMVERCEKNIEKAVNEGRLDAVLTVIALLGELKVAAHDLILERAVEGVHQHAVLGDAELVRLAVGKQVTLTRLDLLNGVETEGQQMSTGARFAILDG